MTFHIGNKPWNKGLHKPMAKRFWSHVEKTDGCWLWTGHCDKQGYGKIRGTHAQRIAWELTHGHIPEGLDVCHHCDNPTCVNPEHLFLGTAADNIADCIQKGRFGYRFGESAHNIKLSWSKVKEIRNSKLSQRRLAEIFGISKANVYYIQKGLTWAEEGQNG